METRDETFPLYRASLLVDIEEKWPGNEKQESNIAYSLIPVSFRRLMFVCSFYCFSSPVSPIFGELNNGGSVCLVNIQMRETSPLPYLPYFRQEDHHKLTILILKTKKAV